MQSSFAKTLVSTLISFGIDFDYKEELKKEIVNSSQSKIKATFWTKLEKKGGGLKLKRSALMKYSFSNDIVLSKTIFKIQNFKYTFSDMYHPFFHSFFMFQSSFWLREGSNPELFK